MPRSLPLSTPCGNVPCGHTLNWHYGEDEGASCKIQGCGCTRFDGFRFLNEPPSSPLVAEAIREELKQRLTAGARDSQVGGDHYAKHAIQPWDIWEAYGLNAFEGAVIKYLLRHRDKGGVEDLKKARHTLDRLIEVEEKKTSG